MLNHELGCAHASLCGPAVLDSLCGSHPTLVSLIGRREPFAPVYRMALSACCVLSAAWLADEPAALAGLDDGSLRLLALTTGRVDGYSAALVKPESGAPVCN